MFILVKKVFARLSLKCLGWKLKGEIPKNVSKIVMIGAPHTTNWDFFIVVCCAWYFGLRVHWLGKESLFANPIMRFFSTLAGGIKVERSGSKDYVDKIAKRFMANTKRVCLVIAPEGTRSKKPGWRSGFYYIAKKANIPIGLGFVDYPKKIMGVGPILYDLKTIEETMAHMKDFYKDFTGKHPAKQSPVQLITQ